MYVDFQHGSGLSGGREPGQGNAKENDRAREAKRIAMDERGEKSSKSR